MSPLIRFIFMTMSLFIIAMFMKPNKNKQIEKFTHFKLPGEYIGSKIHATLDNHGNAICYSYQQPSGDGNLGCTQVPCPNKYQDNIVCWSCCNYH